MGSCCINKFLATLLCIGFTLTGMAWGFDRTLIGEKPNPPLMTAAGDKQQLFSLLGSTKTVVVFWSRWNSFSRLELTTLRDLSSQPKSFAVIAVNVDRQHLTPADVDSAVQYLSDLRCNFTLCFDPELEAFGKLGVAAVPSTFIFDSSGTLIWGLASFLVSDRQELEDNILQKTDSPPPTWRSKIDPKAIHYYRLARQQMLNGDHRMAETNCRYATAIDSLFPDPLILLAALAGSSGDPATIGSLVGRALAIDSNFVPALLFKAKIAFDKSIASEVASWSQRALQVDSSLPLANAFSGWASIVEGRIISGDDPLQIAQETGGMNPLVLYVCARAVELRNHKESAAILYLRALELLLPDSY